MINFNENSRFLYLFLLLLCVKGLKENIVINDEQIFLNNLTSKFSNYSNNTLIYYNINNNNLNNNNSNLYIIQNKIKNINCDKYHCADSSYIKQFSNNQCAYKEIDNNGLYNVHILPCNSTNLICPFYNYNTKLFCQNKYNLPAGSYCKTGNECYNNGLCINNKCSGYLGNQNCKNHKECNPGMSCYLGICKNQLSYEESLFTRCFDDYNCLNNYGCNNGICVKYFSLDNGEINYSGNKLLCKSFYYNYNTKTCESISLIKNNCNDLNILSCSYKIDNRKLLSTTNLDYNFNTDCVCSDSGNSKLYCPFLSSIEINKLNFTDVYYKNINKFDHTLLRVPKLNREYTKVLNYPKYEDADYCLLPSDNYYYIKISLIVLLFVSLVLYI